jgi:hypothetical protein
MLRLILATIPMEEIEERLQIARTKIGQKIPPKIKKIKNISAQREGIQYKPTDVLMQIKSLHGMVTATMSSHSLEDWGDLSLSLISSVTP